MSKLYAKGHYKNTQEGIAERKAAQKRELGRRWKLKKNLSKLLQEEGLAETPAERPTRVASKNKPNPFAKSSQLSRSQKEEREAQIEEQKRKSQEKKERILTNMQKRKETNLKLGKKTKKGQPVMAGIIESILEKLKK
ncbi:hypothetical protein HDV03_004583 [Kappamyces sp. JEL0829]|nr:hypothetical protein HDV03_004583 [Kappamyces sp. JEL0829]